MDVDTTIDTLTLEVEDTITVNNDYTNLINKPSINSIILSGNKTTSDLNISYNDLTNKPTIPTVPTIVSAFTNDVPYLTTHQDISGKADKTYVDNQLATKQNTLTATSPLSITNNTIAVDLSSKQNVLTAGNNIQLNGSTISAIDTTYSAGDNITITNNVISATGGTYTGEKGIAIDSDNKISIDLKNGETALSTDGDKLSLDQTNISYNNLSNKPSIPTKTSELTNDSGFLTSHQDISGKLDKVTTTSPYPYRFYSIYGNGTQAIVNCSAGANSVSVPIRTSTGQLLVQVTPTDNNHATSKVYVDTVDATKVSQVSTTSTNGQVYGVSSAGEQVTYLIDGANGVASKSYVDNLQDEWELINTADFSQTGQEISSVIFSQDSSGNALSLTNFRLLCYMMADSGNYCYIKPSYQTLYWYMYKNISFPTMISSGYIVPSVIDFYDNPKYYDWSLEYMPLPPLKCYSQKQSSLYGSFGCWTQTQDISNYYPFTRLRIEWPNAVCGKILLYGVRS